MATDVIRVVHVAGEPTASRVPQLDLIAERPELDLTVVYCAASIQGRSWTLHPRHRTIMLKGPTLPTSRLLQHDYPVTPGIWRVLADERPDVVVIGGWSVFGVQAALLWCRLRRVPYVLFAESHLAERRSGWVRAIKRAVVPRVVEPAASHLVTGTLAREHAIAYGADPERIWQFANTVDVQRYGAAADELRSSRGDIRRELGIPRDAVAVLHVGRLVPVKGVDVLIAALGETRSRATQLHLLVVGDGSERARLEADARQLSVSATFTGFGGEADLLRAYVAADIFTLLSRRETWGIVVNEAMACGLPLVLSAGVGAAPDLLEPGLNGSVVPIDDPVATAIAIDDLVATPELRKRYSERSRQIIRGWGYEAGVDAFVAAVQVAAGSVPGRHG